MIIFRKGIAKYYNNSTDIHFLDSNLSMGLSVHHGP